MRQSDAKADTFIAIAVAHQNIKDKIDSNGNGIKLNKMNDGEKKKNYTNWSRH